MVENQLQAEVALPFSVRTELDTRSLVNTGEILLMKQMLFFSEIKSLDTCRKAVQIIKQTLNVPARCKYVPHILVPWK